MPADVIIVQRNVIHPRVYDAMAYWQGMGKPVVVDLDDAYHFLPWSNPARPFWFLKPLPDVDGVEREGAGIRLLEEGLVRADGLVAPNKLLLADWEYASGNSYFIQNYAEPSWWGVPPPGPWVPSGQQHWTCKDDDRLWPVKWWRDRNRTVRGLPPRSILKKGLGIKDRIVIGWGGSMSHYDSFWGSGLMQAIPKISARYPEVLWMICGGEKRLYEQLEVPARQKFWQHGVPPQQWPEIVCRFDVGLAPLYGPYDQRRSWIKGIEYALAGTPWVATRGETYKGLIDWPAGLQGPESAEWWEDSLEVILSDLEGWQDKAEALLPEARKRFIIDNNLDKYSQAINQMIADKQQAGQGEVVLPNVIRIPKNGKKEKEVSRDIPTGEIISLDGPGPNGVREVEIKTG